MKKRRRRQRRAISIAVIVIAIIMIIGFAGYVFLQKNNNQEETTGINTPAASTTETKKSDEAGPAKETSDNKSFIRFTLRITINDFLPWITSGITWLRKKFIVVFTDGNLFIIKLFFSSHSSE